MRKLRRGQRVRRKWHVATVTDTDIDRSGRQVVRLDNEPGWLDAEAVIAQHEAYGK